MLKMQKVGELLLAILWFRRIASYANLLVAGVSRELMRNQPKYRHITKSNTNYFKPAQASQPPQMLEVSMFWVYLYKAKTAIDLPSHWSHMSLHFYRETYFSGFLSAIDNSSRLPSFFTYHENLIFKHLMNCFDLKGWYKFLLLPWANKLVAALTLCPGSALRGAAWRVIFRDSYMSQGMEIQNVKTFLCHKSGDTWNFLDTREFWRKDCVSLLFQEDLFRGDGDSRLLPLLSRAYYVSPALVSGVHGHFHRKKLLLILITSCQE